VAVLEILLNAPAFISGHLGRMLIGNGGHLFTEPYLVLAAEKVRSVIALLEPYLQASRQRSPVAPADNASTAQGLLR
jgi:hypothetical protein